LLQLSLTLYHLHHELSVIHRDIKMINVLVMGNGQLKLCDFGLAKEMRGEDDFAKSTVGTPYYLSP
jgi:NIMA (never in mitosis gene a)-related kinase